jgi:alpha/beta superfamily hydrolase
MIWGVVIGAAACAILGFTWGGWVTGSTARKDAMAAGHSATVMALAPYCAERFRAQGDATAKMAELAKASTWERSNVVEKSGFAVMPGTKTNDSDIARACAELLMVPATPKT